MKSLDFQERKWDNPTMKLVADSRGRLTAAELFRPGTAFEANRMPDGSIRLSELVKKETPVVELKRTGEGFLMLPVKVSNEAIAAAIRADRDAQ
ncbi:MAG TPA: hypothetical protein VMH30_00860 [Verrucomicrobiae bacterium]|nr:hypothetical protein [Verrucomicrobiae bacterium]